MKSKGKDPYSDEEETIEEEDIREFEVHRTMPYSRSQTLLRKYGYGKNKGSIVRQSSDLNEIKKILRQNSDDLKTMAKSNLQRAAKSILQIK